MDRKPQKPQLGGCGRTVHFDGGPSSTLGEPLAVGSNFPSNVVPRSVGLGKGQGGLWAFQWEGK